MSRPTPEQISLATGVPSRLIPLLQNRGMPRNSVRKAMTWWDRSGLTVRDGKIEKVGKNEA